MAKSGTITFTPTHESLVELQLHILQRPDDCRDQNWENDIADFQNTAIKQLRDAKHEVKHWVRCLARIADCVNDHSDDIPEPLASALNEITAEYNTGPTERTGGWTGEGRFGQLMDEVKFA